MYSNIGGAEVIFSGRFTSKDIAKQLLKLPPMVRKKWFMTNHDTIFDPNLLIIKGYEVGGDDFHAAPTPSGGVSCGSPGAVPPSRACRSWWSRCRRGRAAPGPPAGPPPPPAGARHTTGAR